MNRRAKLSAREVLNDYDLETLSSLFKRYGELDSSRRIARCVVDYREKQPIERIQDLTDALAPVLPRNGESKFLAKLFQAIRIEVNGEMNALEMMLEQSLRVLRPGGRLAVITYHSLEDRMVKNFMRSGNFEGKAVQDFYGRVLSPWSVVTRKAVVPSPEEVARNPRSRSAKLRVVSKL